MPPFLGGGNMIADVRLDGFTPAPVPAKFEAGTPPITEAIGFGAAVDFLEASAWRGPRARDGGSPGTRSTRSRALRRRHRDPRPDQRRASAAACSASRSATSTPTTVSQVLDQRNVCVRAGHHCAKPLMRVLGVAATARASFYLYNDRDDVDALADALDGAVRHLRLLGATTTHARSRRPLPRDHPRPLPHAAQPRRAADAAGASSPRATTRCAATRSPCSCSVDGDRVERRQGRRPGLLDLARARRR